MLEEFTVAVRPRLDAADFALKRQVVEALNLRFDLNLEGDEKVVYIKWLNLEFRQRIAKKQASESRGGQLDTGDDSDL